VETSYSFVRSYGFLKNKNNLYQLNGKEDILVLAVSNKKIWIKHVLDHISIICIVIYVCGGFFGSKFNI